MSSSKGRARPRGARGSGSGHSPSGNSGIVQSPIPHTRRQRANLDEIGKFRSAAAFLPEQTLCWSVNSIRADFETETKLPGGDVRRAKVRMVPWVRDPPGNSVVRAGS